MNRDSLRTRIGPLLFFPVTLPQAVDEIIDLARTHTPAHVHLANAYSVALADRNAQIRGAFTSRGSLVLADGKPINWASTLLRQSPRIRQVRGPSLFRGVMDHGRVAGLKHYLLGSTNDRLEAMEAVLVAAHPGVVIAGMASPPFRELTEEERIVQARNIRASGADIVWVGLGTPKQDIEAERLAIELGIPAVAVGAAFDFTAGAVREAPRWCRAIGLEWAYRLWREPRRLWRRYLIGNPQFVVSVVRGYLQSVGS